MNMSFFGRLPKGIVPIFIVFSLLASLAGSVSYAGASEQIQNGQHLIVIHDRGEDRSIITSHSTLRSAFKEAHILLDNNDRVEPGLDETLKNPTYQVNVYRARPITIVDGTRQVRVMTAYQTPEQIAKNADMPLRPEDKTTMQLADNIITDGPSQELVIDRALKVDLLLYGNQTPVYTQSKTVAAFLKEKKITLAKDDTISVSASDAIADGMKIEIWRNGEQTKTEEQPVAFPTREIQDADQPVGYRQVKTPGVTGKKTVTYKVTMKNGQEIARQEISSVVTQQPSEEVVVVGAKQSFDGDFANALAKLRSCEGGYNSYNPAGYYGAYQFDRGTWQSVTSAPYGNASPAEQDAAARKLYERRGWSPWPNCGRGLPDVYR